MRYRLKVSSEEQGNKISAFDIDVNKPIKVLYDTGHELRAGGNLYVMYITNKGKKRNGYIDHDMLEEWSDEN